MESVIEHFRKIIRALSVRPDYSNLDNDGEYRTALSQGWSDLPLINDYKGIDRKMTSKAEKKVQLLFDEAMAKSEKTGESVLDILRIPLVDIMEHQQELENKLIEFETRINKYDGGKNRKNTADNFAVEMLPKVIEAQKKGFTASRKIADYFNEKGFPSATGKKFASASIYRLLKRQKELGLFDQENDTPAL